MTDKKLKNIVHLTHKSAHQDSRILKEMSALKRCDEYRITLLDIGVAYSKQKEMLLDEGIFVYRIAHPFMNLNYPRYLKHFLTLIICAISGVLALRRISPVLMHVHDTPMLLAAVIYKRYFDNDAVLVYDAHELESSKAGQSALMSRITLRIESWAWRFINHLIVVADSIGEWYETELGKKEHSIVFNAPEIAQRARKPESAKPINQPIEFCYVGKLVQGRSLDVLIESFASQSFGKDKSLHIYGYGPMESEIRALASECETVYFHGRLRHGDITDVISAHDVGVCVIENVSLSDFYSMPNKLFEYAFSELYIIGSDFPEMNEFIKYYGRGKAIGETNDDLVTCIRDLCAQDLLNAKGGRDLSRYLWSAQATKLRGLYANLVR